MPEARVAMLTLTWSDPGCLCGRSLALCRTIDASLGASLTGGVFVCVLAAFRLAVLTSDQGDPCKPGEIGRVDARELGHRSADAYHLIDRAFAGGKTCVPRCKCLLTMINANQSKLHAIACSIKQLASARRMCVGALA